MERIINFLLSFFFTFTKLKILFFYAKRTCLEKKKERISIFGHFFFFLLNGCYWLSPLFAMLCNILSFAEIVWSIYSGYNTFLLFFWLTTTEFYLHLLFFYSTILFLTQILKFETTFYTNKKTKQKSLVCSDNIN